LKQQHVFFLTFLVSFVYIQNETKYEYTTSHPLQVKAFIIESNVISGWSSLKQTEFVDLVSTFVVGAVTSNYDTLLSTMNLVNDNAKRKGCCSFPDLEERVMLSQVMLLGAKLSRGSKLLACRDNWCVRPATDEVVSSSFSPVLVE
jgi:hypothetical protein